MKNSQILDQIKECAKIHHIVEFFGVGEVEAFEMLEDICAHFSNRDEAYGFLSFIKDDNELTHNEKHGCDDPAYTRNDL